MFIGTDKLMTLVQTRRQELKHDSLTSIVSTSGGSTGTSPATSAQLRARWLAAACGYGVARARSIHTNLTIKIKNKLRRIREPLEPNSMNNAGRHRTIVSDQIERPFISEGSPRGFPGITN
jgi:hypothetical protein